MEEVDGSNPSRSTISFQTLASSLPVQHLPTGVQLESKFKMTHGQELVRKILLEECGNNLPFLKNLDAAAMDRFRFAALKLSRGNLDGLRDAVRLFDSRKPTGATCWSLRDLLTASTRMHHGYRTGHGDPPRAGELVPSPLWQSPLWSIRRAWAQSSRFTGLSSNAKSRMDYFFRKRPRPSARTGSQRRN